jgi:hypothetical protein
MDPAEQVSLMPSPEDKTSSSQNAVLQCFFFRKLDDGQNPAILTVFLYVQNPWLLKGCTRLWMWFNHRSDFFRINFKFLNLSVIPWFYLLYCDTDKESNSILSDHLPILAK